MGWPGMSGFPFFSKGEEKTKMDEAMNHSQIAARCLSIQEGLFFDLNKVVY